MNVIEYHSYDNVSTISSTNDNFLHSIMGQQIITNASVNDNIRNVSQTSECRNNGELRVRFTDHRKHNRGSSHRKSYSIDVKIRAIELRDNGMSVGDVSKVLNTAKSNVEKWCSSKVYIQIFNYSLIIL